MKNSKIFFIGLILILNFTIDVVTVRAADEEEENYAREERERTVAKKDTYVERDNPTANNGGKDWLSVSNSSETYLYFEFEDEPDDWKEVEISFYIYYISGAMLLEIYLIEPGWDELALTWLNKPNKSKLIDTFTVAEAGIYRFEVTDEVEDLLDDDKESISICIISTNITSSDHFLATSRDGYSLKDDAPLLYWTYYLENVDYTLVIILIIIILGVGEGVVIIVFVVKFRKKKPKEPKEIFCPSCGVKLTNKVKVNFCPSCGANVNE